MFPPVSPSYLYNSQASQALMPEPPKNNFLIPNMMNNSAVEIPPPPVPETINYREVFRKISLKNLQYPDITKRLVVLDTQGTGEDPSNNNIIELGCYEMFEGHCTGRQFHGFLHPRFEIDEYTEQKIVGNMLYDFTKDAKESDSIVLDNFMNFVGDSKIVVHNKELNMAFLNNEFKYHNKELLKEDKFYCTLTIFHQLFPDINTNATINDLLVFYDLIIKKRKKEIRVTNNVCSLLKCCEYLKIKVPKKLHFSAKFDSFLITKLMARLFVVIAKIQKLHIKIREKLRNKKKMLSLQDKGTNNDTTIGKINNNINNLIMTRRGTTSCATSVTGRSENRKITRSIYQDIYNDIRPEEDNKFDNIMELIEQDYKTSDSSYYNQFNNHKVDNELINIIDNHKIELKRIQNGYKSNGYDLTSLNKHRIKSAIYKNGKNGFGYGYKNKNLYYSYKDNNKKKTTLNNNHNDDSKNNGDDDDINTEAP